MKKKIDWIIVFGLAFLTLLTRIPYATKFLFAWDSGTVALGTIHYDLAQHEPHPPGYVFYVLLTKIIDYFVHDANTVLVWISIISSILAVIFLYLLGKEMFGRIVGIIAALILIFSKIFWAYSEVAFSYTLQCFFATLIAYLGYKYIKNTDQKKYLYLGSIALGIAGGFRQDLIVFMIPLWIFVTFKYGRKDFWKNWLIIFGICVVWMLGMIFWDGGFKDYFDALFNQFGYVSGFSAEKRGLLGLIDNYKTMLLFLNEAIQPFTAVIFFSAYVFLPKKIKNDARSQVLLLWLLPSLIFYIFVHIGERGYLLTFISVLILILAYGLVWFVGEICKLFKFNRYVKPITLTILTVILISFNGYYFVKTKDFLSLSHLQLQDKATKEKINYIEQFKAGKKNFIDRENYKQLHYYLPEQNIFPDAKEITDDKIETIDLMKKFPVL
ncbi:MAG: DUF2723 domain-containing protein [Patescibacteria group bacterium]|nr:DUF2723 domain-containing protein [Patescibacteria group bacterium]